jgi:hypothetical protein
VQQQQCNCQQAYGGVVNFEVGSRGRVNDAKADGTILNCIQQPQQLPKVQKRVICRVSITHHYQDFKTK